MLSSHEHSQLLLCISLLVNSVCFLHGTKGSLTIELDQIVHKPVDSPNSNQKSPLMFLKSKRTRQLSTEAATQKRKPSTVGTTSSMSRSHRSDKEKFNDTTTFQQVFIPRWQLGLPGLEELPPLSVYVPAPRPRIGTQQPVKNQALSRTTQRTQSMYDNGESHQSRREIPSLKYAMGVLYRELDNATSFYKGFKDSFDKETRELTYIPQDKLDDIWAERVNEKCQVDDEPDEFGNTDTSQANQPRAQQPKFWKRFVDTKRNVVRSADEVLDSVALSRKRAADSSTQIHAIPAKHFQDKVSFAIDQVKELMDLAMLSPDACAALSRELGSLKDLVNPRSEILKELYKSKGLDDEI